jgi:SPX domain protein involved in polyphosphate accumulation
MIRKFNRFEFKYLIHHSDYLKIVPYLKKNMRKDYYANVSGRYNISSLYFDTNEYIFYNDKIDGFKYRRKLRLRVYPQAKIRKGFVEIKQRVDRTVQKRRILLPLEKAVSICQGNPIKMKNPDQFATDTANEILYLVKALRLKPACIISYQREAYEGNRYDIGVRVTLDCNLTYRTHNFDVTCNNGNHFFIPPDYYVLEIKVNETMPFWLHELISNMQFELRRISKYCLGIQKHFQKMQYQRISY